MKNTTRFRKKLEESGAILAPGCYDCYSAKILENIGFESLYLTGYGAEATKLGMPDLGLMTLVEMAELAGNIVNSVEVPLISDIDIGYGGVLNIGRTINKFEQAGVAAVHIEDQPYDKKCSLMDGRTVIGADNMVMKIKAAIEARNDKDFVIIARTDAKEPVSFDETLRRLHMYLDAGADLVMTPEADSYEEFEVLGREFNKKVAVVIGNGVNESTALPSTEYEKMGIKLLINPTAILGAAGKAIETVGKIIFNKGYISNDRLKDLTYLSDDINELLSLDKYENIINKYTI